MEFTASEQALLDTETWALRVISWKQWVHGLSKSSYEHNPLGEHRIDLQCRMERGLLRGDLLVGEDPVENLGDLNFKIQLRSAQRIFSEFEAKDITVNEKIATGFLVYQSPIPAEDLAGLPSRIIEESKTGSVTGWAFFPDAGLWEIARSLAVLPEREMHLSLTLRAAAGPEPGLLVYERQGHRPAAYRWSGKHWLIVHEIAFLNRPIEEPVLKNSMERKDEASEILEAIDRAAETLNRSVLGISRGIAQIGVLVLVLLAAIMFGLWYFR
jgi:hypothetical protein